MEEYYETRFDNSSTLDVLCYLFDLKSPSVKLSSKKIALRGKGGLKPDTFIVYITVQSG